MISTSSESHQDFRQATIGKKRTPKILTSLATWVLVGFGGGSALADTPTPDSPNFASQIRPLLSDHCFACHGPDEHDRQAGLRLDTADGIADVVDTEDWQQSLIVERLRTDDPDRIMPPPGHHKPLNDQAKSLLESWVASGAVFEDHWAFVPPRRHATEDNQRAARIDHWIDRAINQNGLEPNGPTDRMTLARRVAFDLTGLPPNWDQVQRLANAPSPDTEEFNRTYEAYVDRLLDSPAYGEHMARYWLDLVRYGDTHGLHLDNYREMWPYRDWVIDAFNSNKPFDVFITEQLAGDLLPDPSIEQQVASGFNRLNVTTSEGGSIYDEVFARNVMDRTDAFGSIFLGLTTGCAVCHDHKFDPITQEDYYSLSAYFNSLDGRALDGNKKDHPPSIKLPSDEQKTKLEEIKTELAYVDAQMKGPLEEVDAAQLAWQRSLNPNLSGQLRERVETPLVPTSAESKSGTQATIRDGDVVLNQPSDQDDIEIQLPIPPGQWRTITLTANTDEKNSRVGLSANGNAVLSEITFEYHDRADPEDVWKPLKIVAGYATVQQDDQGFAIEKSFDGIIDNDTGWAVAGHESKGPRTAQFELATPLEVATGNGQTKLRVRMSYQSRYAGHLLRSVHFQVTNVGVSRPLEPTVRLGDVHVAGPIKIKSTDAGYSNEYGGESKNEFDPTTTITSGDRQFRWQHRADVLPVVTNRLPVSRSHPSVALVHQSIEADSEHTIDLVIGNDDGHVVYLNGDKIGTQRGSARFKPLRKSYSIKLKKGANHLFVRMIRHRGQGRLAFAFHSPKVAIPDRLANRLSSLTDTPISERIPAEIQSIRSFYRDSYCQSSQWLALKDMRNGLLTMRTDLEKQVPSTLVWKETATPRDAFILQRGQYDSPGEKVPRRTLGFLPPMDPSAPNDRLGLATWLTQPNHPLTARVAINRFWQQIFGAGLVKTSEDFGSQGTPPSHPELLDELAIEFRESGWDVKSFMKRLVMTRAYQRSSKTSPTILAADPNNRLLARGPRFRLDAEMLRDQMLALSGLLVDQRGGPSVKPPQPAGLWAAVGYTDSDTATFVADEGDRIYRRSVYTFWKRTSAPAVMTTFDAPSRESCTARRERTNTPLQALLLLNEPQTLESSQRLAEQALAWEMDAAVVTNQVRVTRLFQRVVLRNPTLNEIETLVSLATDLSNYYSNHLDQAKALVGMSDAGLAAWTILSNTLLNLDEVVNK